MRVLVVEDDPRLAELVARTLRDNAYAVDVVSDGESAIVEASVTPYDAIVLDVMLPGKSGMEVCRTLRARAIRTPVLMLTARDAVQDRVAGLDSGADDYLVKPFELAELLARLRALLRRAPELLPARLSVADLEVDTHMHQARRGGRDIPLTTKEYAMLEHLARNAGRVVGRAELCEHVWDANHDPFSNAIEVYINRLRKKIDQGSAVPLIHTRRGAGYLLAALGAEDGRHDAGA
ncbi:MAG TPA: response regulator transcription factor [Gemmatimonadaceae bacterium]|nr:response regulator transcription factor [Gemmatimonadaceae bacterium]